jgi:hypothetical protein
MGFKVMHACDGMEALEGYTKLRATALSHACASLMTLLQ